MPPPVGYQMLSLEWMELSVSGSLPLPRCGHTATMVEKRLLVYGGRDNKLWFQPKCTGSGSEDQVGPSPRAFYIAVAIDCHMFVFGGRYGSKRLGDFWVLQIYGSGLSSPVLVTYLRHEILLQLQPLGTGKLLCMVAGMVKGGYQMLSLECMELSVSGSLPSPRCGHKATMVEKRLLDYGGRGEVAFCLLT
ncbi:protein GLUTELIN PRECURSOR ACCUMULATION 3-like [Quercus robur]|uniref:protein GLUTELIN PRECURSOR ACCUMULATION 3-like n=1 Tax=Quercus robur TaxID=38942 RepID=UPI002162B1DE|nr:protein GLUTELIN PRECURSOR ACCUMULATION 3-like [Quercus robur]